MSTDPAIVVTPLPPERSSTAPTSPRGDLLCTLAIVGGLLIILAARPVIRRLSPHPSREQCTALLTRYAELSESAALLAPTGDSARRSTVLEPARPADIDRCASTITLEEFACAMRSTNADELERCLP